MTRDALKVFGIETEYIGDLITVHAGHYRSPGEVIVEGDWSNAAFWLTANAISAKKVTCVGLDESSSQGDRAITQMLQRIREGSAVIDAGQIPDLVPILSVAAALTPGETKIIHAGRLRLKESDRLQAVQEMLTELGADAVQTEDGLIIRGTEKLRGGITHSRNDHRIAMSAAIAAIGCENPVTIQCAEAVEKSYPAFFSDYAALGGHVTKEEA